MRFFEVDSAVDAIMSAAMLAQTKAGSRNQQGKLSMNGFLQMLKNAGIMMDYEGFKTVYDTNPQLANVIAKFDKDSITFLSADGDDEAVDNTEPSNQIPPDERVAQMARKAVKTREFVESVVTKGAIDTLRAIVDNKQNMPVKFADGQMKVDLFTASAITKVYDAVNDANKEKLERMMQTKAGMMRVADFAMDQVKMENVNEAANTQAHRVLVELDNLRSAIMDKINELPNVDDGDLTDQIVTMEKVMKLFEEVLQRSFKIIPMESIEEAAIPTSEFDYDLKKFYEKIKELEDQNQHGEVAEMLVNLYGNDAEAMIIRGINGLHSMQGSIMPEQQKLRDMISTKYYKQLEQEVKDMKEGFASDAQRKAAFASGYKPNKKKIKERSLTKGEQKEKERIVKGMKKAKDSFKDRYGDDAKAVMYATATKLAKEDRYPKDYIQKGPRIEPTKPIGKLPKDYIQKGPRIEPTKPIGKLPDSYKQLMKREDVNEGMEDKIEKDIDAGMSNDAIIGKYANKRTTNTDEIRKIIQRIKFKKFKGRN